MVLIWRFKVFEQGALVRLVQYLSLPQGNFAVVLQSLVVDVEQSLREPQPLLAVNRVAQLFGQDLLGTSEVPLAVEIINERSQGAVGRDRKNTSRRALIFRERRLEQVGRFGGPAVVPQRTRERGGDVQAVIRPAGLQIVQRPQLTELFVGERFRGDGAKSAQVVGHQPLFSFSPIALVRAFQSGQYGGDVRTGLILYLGGPSRDLRVQHVEGPLIDIGNGPFPDF